VWPCSMLSSSISPSGERLIFLTRKHLGGESHRSLVVADQSSYGKLVQRMLPQWKVSGTTRGGRLHSFVEVPLYVDSKASRVVQAADCVAWAIFNYYERGHASTCSG
jgi:uncharacterized protein DUF3800